MCCSSQRSRIAERNFKKRLAATLVQPSSKIMFASNAGKIVEELSHDDVSDKATQTSPNLENQITANCELEPVLENKIKGLQTELEMVSATLHESEVEVNRLKETVETIVLDERSFVENNVKVLYYTGLTNWEI